MNEIREKRWASVVQDKASHFFLTNSDRSSLITVTRVELVDRGKKARVLFSVLPQSRESQALAFAKRHEKSIRKELERLYSGFVPYIECDIDPGEKNRQRIDELSQDSHN